MQCRVQHYMITMHIMATAARLWRGRRAVCYKRAMRAMNTSDGPVVCIRFVNIIYSKSLISAQDVGCTSGRWNTTGDWRSARQRGYLWRKQQSRSMKLMVRNVCFCEKNGYAWPYVASVGHVARMSVGEGGEWTCVGGVSTRTAGRGGCGCRI